MKTVEAYFPDLATQPAVVPLDYGTAVGANLVEMAASPIRPLVDGRKVAELMTHHQARFHEKLQIGVDRGAAHPKPGFALEQFIQVFGAEVPLCGQNGLAQSQTLRSFPQTPLLQEANPSIFARGECSFCLFRLHICHRTAGQR